MPRPRAFTVALWALAVLLGLAAGIGAFTFVYAHGAAYLTDEPSACANCHVMNEQYAGWTRSSHRAVAVCNDCHTPAGHVAKYVTKANNGFWHSFYFTTGGYPDHIRAGRRNKAIAEASCQKCHAPITSANERCASAGPTPGVAASSCGSACRIFASEPKRFISARFLEGPTPGISSRGEESARRSRRCRWYVIAKRWASSRRCCRTNSASDPRGIDSGSGRSGEAVGMAGTAFGGRAHGNGASGAQE